MLLRANVRTVKIHSNDWSWDCRGHFTFLQGTPPNLQVVLVFNLCNTFKFIFHKKKKRCPHNSRRQRNLEQGFSWELISAGDSYPKLHLKAVNYWFIVLFIVLLLIESITCFYHIVQHLLIHTVLQTILPFHNTWTLHYRNFCSRHNTDSCTLKFYLKKAL